MTRAEILALYSEAAENLFGTRWQSDAARHHGVSIRTMQRWVALEQDIPVGIVREIFDLVGRRVFELEDLQERISRAMGAHLAEQAGAADDAIDKTA